MQGFLSSPKTLQSFTMDREVSIVLSVERRNYRKLAQDWYGLTDEQMVDMDVHHNPPRSQGGRNIPEHLYVYHNTLHTAVHDHSFVSWSRIGGQKAHEVRDINGKSVHGLRLAAMLHPVIHSEKDEEGRSVHAIKAGKAAHKVKDEDGKSIHAKKCAAKVHEKKDGNGKSLHTLKLHEKKDERGRSVQGVKCYQFLASVHNERDEFGRSLHSLRIHKERDEFGRSLLGIRNGKTLNSKKWFDPDHPELGIHSAGTLVNMQKARGYPHGSENRVRVE